MARPSPAIDPEAVIRCVAEAAARRTHERHRAPFDEESPGFPAEVTDVVVAVLERHAFGAPPHHVAGEVTRPILDQHPHLDDHVGIARTASLLFEVVENVAHGSSCPGSGVRRAGVFECGTGTVGGRGTSNGQDEVTGDDANPTA